MSTNATTFTVPGAMVGSSGTMTAGVAPRSRTRMAVAAASLAVIVGISLLIVLLAANRPSFLVPTTNYLFFPHWLAGPLGGLLPGFTRSSQVLKYVFTIGIVVMYVAYIVALNNVRWLRARWVIAAVVAAQLVMLMSPPLSLTDVFNYINYGRMEIVHHLNPYATIPYMEPHSDPSFDLSNWHHLLSPYGPLFTIMTFALVPLGVPASFWVLKVVLMLASLGTIGLVWACARLLDRDAVQAIVFVGLNPLVLLWGLGGDHNDFLMMLMIMLAFYLLLRARSLRAPPPHLADTVRMAPVAAVDAAPPTVLASTVAAPPASSGGWWRGRSLPWTGAGGRLRGHGGVLAPLRRHRGGAPAPAGEATAGVDAGAGGADTALPAAAPADGNGAIRSLVAERAPVSERVRALFWPLAPLDIAAGTALVTATAIKASAGILLPVVLVALLVRPRDLVQVLIGVVVAGVALAAATHVAFGLHLPDLSTQDKLVTSVSIPNLVGLATAQGGETQTIRTAMTVLLVIGVAVCAWWASRHRDLGPHALVTGAGWASVVLVVTLSWVLPWYVLWTLPLAVLSGSRALRNAALILGVYLILAWMPLQADLFNLIGFHPLSTPLGQMHQREARSLLR